jgi:DNA-binding MarR family transcriptional regulator
MKNTDTPIPCACTSVRRLARLLARTYDSALARSGMNVTQLAVLRAIERHSGESLSRVADDLVMDRTTLYRALAVLRKCGWIELGEGVDARSRCAYIRPDGHKALLRAHPAWTATQVALIEKFGVSRWQRLVRDMAFLTECANSLPTGQKERIQ